MDPLIQHQFESSSKRQLSFNSKLPKFILAIIGFVILTFVLKFAFDNIMGNGAQDRIRKQYLTNISNALNAYKNNHKGNLPHKHSLAWRKDFFESSYLSRAEFVNPVDKEPYRFEVEIKQCQDDELLSEQTNASHTIFFHPNCDCKNKKAQGNNSVAIRIQLSDKKFSCLEY